MSTAESWLLLTGSRTAVAAAIAVGIFAVVVAVTLSGAVPLRRYEAMLYVFSGLITGNLTIITVVVSINQLLLSRELRTPPDLKSEIDGMIDYRRTIEDEAGQIAPVEPLGFLRLLFETTRQRAQRLGGLSTTEADAELASDIDRVVTEITRSADRVDDLLKTSDVGTFEVLSTTLNTNYARDINRLRQIKSRHADRMPDHIDDAVDGLVELLQNIDIARQYLKSVYLQQELAKLSRLLFYAGLPSVVVVTVALLVFTASDGAALPRSLLRLVVPVVITVGLVPLAVLASFIVRTATVAERTAAIIPFTTPTQEE
ncbi:hypothetical protein NDI56_06090 [Haloarcula sp. S1CR25-12]|uniref:DUF4239 domain-containing protein n=1 Tax=Haloarcula saliterrae TaxID=2950534 RepID=A0ABU2F9K3_9EURY|nr:hypothetical protein [Haloarcula sp. S1CR25-12]MDS0258960.1 hypothetical protein [Haloarcula sp. S1CR25-12]